MVLRGHSQGLIARVTESMVQLAMPVVDRSMSMWSPWYSSRRGRAQRPGSGRQEGRQAGGQAGRMAGWQEGR